VRQQTTSQGGAFGALSRGATTLELNRGFFKALRKPPIFREGRAPSKRDLTLGGTGKTLDREITSLSARGITSKRSGDHTLYQCQQAYLLSEVKSTGAYLKVDLYLQSVLCGGQRRMGREGGWSLRELRDGEEERSIGFLNCRHPPGTDRGEILRISSSEEVEDNCQ